MPQSSNGMSQWTQCTTKPIYGHVASSNCYFYPPAKIFSFLPWFHYIKNHVKKKQISKTNKNIKKSLYINLFYIIMQLYTQGFIIRRIIAWDLFFFLNSVIFTHFFRKLRISPEFNIKSDKKFEPIASNQYIHLCFDEKLFPG